MTGDPGAASSVPPGGSVAPSGSATPAGDRGRPSIAERAARRDEMQAHGRDRYATLLRSLQAGHELPIHRRGGRIAIDWNPILWTLIRVAVVVLVAYLAIRVGTQWWRESRVATWSGPDATVQSGVRLAGCPIVDRIRVDDFPSWVLFEGSIYRYTGDKRPYLGPTTPGFVQTPFTSGAMRLA
ncbi:MAG TPA: hypothetical protein VER83_01680, partial [Candidatus Nanopelagicales bacterium]|nr:hypothetical protein [Candidatus Nanopelagicales bacterium]